jgi:hypothetical protein
MENSIPQWPVKMTREERKQVSQRQKEFEAALKQRAKGTGWRFTGGTIFRQQDDWFVSASPRLTWQRGVQNQLNVKPMALDPLFWEIVGLEENNELPLSFRVNGAWVLRPPSIDEFKNGKMIDPEKLANATFEWTHKWRAKNLATYSVDKLLAQLDPLENTSGHYRAVAICLLILREDFQRARTLCDAERGDVGGFFTSGGDGPSYTFYQQARNWLDANNR